ncbi:UNVERIFIED_CONTAM: hypothetical protein FKN15_049529 [Acipenser sinensis]
MEHLRVKRKWLREGETSGEVERLSHHIQELGTELLRMDEQARSCAEVSCASGVRTTLRGEAPMALLNSAEEEMGSYRTLVATLQRQIIGMNGPSGIYEKDSVVLCNVPPS